MFSAAMYILFFLTMCCLGKSDWSQCWQIQNIKGAICNTLGLKLEYLTNGEETTDVKCFMDIYPIMIMLPILYKDISKTMGKLF